MFRGEGRWGEEGRREKAEGGGEGRQEQGCRREGEGRLHLRSCSLAPHSGQHMGPLASQFIWAFLFLSHLWETLETFPASESGRVPSFPVRGPALPPTAVLLMALNTLRPWPKDHARVLSRIPDSISSPGTSNRGYNPLTGSIQPRHPKNFIL